MTAGDITVLGPYSMNDNAAVVTALSGAVVIADDIITWNANGQVWFGVVKAA